MVKMKMTTNAEIEIRLVKIEQRLTDMEEKLEYHNKVLVRGNGQLSLIEEVHNVVQFMTDTKDNYRYWSRWIIAGIAANIIGFSTAALVWFIKIAPLLQEVLRVHGIGP